ncbi:MAG TPA: oxygenase MpaB family protein [Actinomycetospora sp.]|uniref:oxygenase MpaB family protein n=1 Tax=Actinomycetospora sp. TaxID=1872135 RepID=UPI002F3F7C64
MLSEPSTDARPRRAADTVSAAVVLGATANVIMQLARPAVGYGVVESRVDRGNLMLHPLHRLRTTSTYLSVTMLGDERDVRSYRRAVGRSHAQVHSTDDSPVAYDAFDRELQMWVAGCLVRAFEDTWALLAGRPGAWLPDEVYHECAALGTGLQVRPHQWPADRAAFERWWDAQLEHVHLDDTVRGYLWGLVEQEFLPAPLRPLLAPSSRFLTAGFLREPFRSLMGFAWSDADQERFERTMRRLGAVLNRTPGAVRRFPYNAFLADVRARRLLGMPLV